MEKRAPIIVVMGHIDHGKSTLLDYIRKTDVGGEKTEPSRGEAGSPRWSLGEAGGITQKISASEISHQGKLMTFIDTPGHDAFSSMRTQSATAADIAVLVVSAEDGVKPQTLEAKTAIEENKLPYVVAINKIDKPEADIERTKQNLLENGVYLEGFGGEVPWTAVSAKTGQGVPELLDLVLLMAEVAELKKDDGQPAEGHILEAGKDQRRGITATVLITNGTLRVGDYLVAGNDCFRLKKLEDSRGRTATALTASSPAVIWGWNAVPPTGARWRAARDKAAAEKIAAAQPAAERKTEPAAAREAGTAEEKIVPLIIKADSPGALEAVKKEIGKIAVAGVKVKILEAGVGTVNDSDLKLGRAMPETIIIGFKVKMEKSAQEATEKHDLTGATFEIIYQLSDWLETELNKRKPAVEVEKIIGSAKIIKLFSRTKNKQIIGAQVSEGRVAPKHQARIKRRGVALGTGEILELRQQQATINEADKGKQFGALVESRHGLALGDILEVLEIERK